MAKNLKILTDSDPGLRKVSQEIDLTELKNLDLINFLDDLEKTMKENDGVGLAAPQVGKNIRIVVIGNKGKNMIMINPQITKRSWAKEWSEEGCLSVPGCFGQVQRNKKINCFYWDKNGQKIKLKAENLTARVIQHELDHLDGILFTDKAKKLKKPSK